MTKISRRETIKNAKKEKPEAPKLAVRRYCRSRALKASNILIDNYDENDAKTSVGDLLADLMHLCEAKKIDFLQCYESGRMHFNAELTGGEHA